MKEEKNKTMDNYRGVKLGRRITDFIAGANSPLEDGYLNLSGDWDVDRPEHELQNKGFETYACLIFSGFDCLETLFMYYLKDKSIPAEYVKWLSDNGYFENGFINFSDRFAAQFADIEIGTGTHVYKANNAIRNYLIPERMLPYEKENYYAKYAVTDDMLRLNEEFKKRFTINWQWEEVPSVALKKSPLQAVVRFANGDGILKPEGELNHGIQVYKEDQDSYYIDDNYAQRNKRYGKDYVFYFVSYSLTINYKKMDTKKFIEENDLKFVRNKNTGQFGRILQGILRTVVTNDRGALLALDKFHRDNGVTVSNDEWKQIPSKEF